MDNFGGVRVVTSDHMQDFVIKQNKMLSHKNWMVGKCYFMRVNKKWLKKYGETKERLFITNGNVIFVSPANAKFLANKLKG